MFCYYKTKPIYDKNGKNVSRKHLYTRFNQLAKEICPDENERLNVILDITYGYKGNRQFCWDCIGELIVNRLLELESEKCIS